MPKGDSPSELTMFDALDMYGVLEGVDPLATDLERAEDAAAFAILDAISDGRERAGISTTAELVIKLADQMKGN